MINPLYMVGKLADIQKRRRSDKENRFILLNRNNEPNDTEKLKAVIDLEIRKNLGQKIEDYQLKIRNSEYITKRDCIIYNFFLLFRDHHIRCLYTQFAEIFNLGDHSTIVDLLQRTSNRIKNPQYPEYQTFWDLINS